QASMFQGMVEIHDLQAVLEVLPAHISQSIGTVNEHHDFCGTAHAPPEGLLAQKRPKLVDGFETGNVGGRVPVPHRSALLIASVLRKDAPQINLAGLGLTIGLLAFAPDWLLRYYRH